jgi:hypothetical protein
MMDWIGGLEFLIRGLVPGRYVDPLGLSLCFVSVCFSA